MELLRRWVRWVDSHRVVSLLVLLALVAGGVFGRRAYRASQGVLTEPLARGAIVETVYGIGTVTANRSYQIKSGVTSTLLGLFVQEGQAVKKGDRLLNIDSVVHKAPFDGTVTSVPIQAGENIFAAMNVLTLVDLHDRYVVVSLEQQGALRVQKGQAARLSFDSQRDRTYEGKVVSVYSSATSFLARIDVKDLPDNVLPGMTADVAIAIREKSDVLLAPVAALEEGKYLWIKRGRGPPERLEAKVGIIDRAFAEIESAEIHAGDRALIRTSP